MTRRELLATAAAPAVLRAQSPNDRVRVAVIGVGNRGSFTIKELAQVPGVDVVAICDLDEARARAAAAGMPNPDGVAIFTDAHRMLETARDIDAVMIATPVDTHRKLAVAALDTGKHVYCEKPMAHTEEDTRAMVAAAKTAKGIFQSGFQLRHDPKRRAGIEHVHSGGIGRVLYLQGYRHTGDLPYNAPWLFDKTRSGDIIVEQSCHILDLLVWAAGKPPLRAMGSGGIGFFRDVPPGRSVMDNFAVIYEFPDGLRLSFGHHYFDPPGFSGIQERVYGEKGAVDLPAGTWTAREKRGATPLPYEKSDKSMDYLSLAAFIDNARARRTPLNSADSAALSTMVALMGRRAIYEGRIVTWEEMQRS